ncbi:type III-B CRISPR module-associated protein Cmr5 [Clostridium botulinum]|uniref:CRISPR type III-B/RAMP module-associated protein Cmr5 n=1 Tax=Clostridium botulinum (strain 657 / Type Ba4) TaxID=515621 RepID=A0A3F3A4I6_CLOB6|nr:type III-B CRISPR module-associated protein Cmr5 [Clostridium botulinum]ACQ53237.1 crispr-associated protein, Cmr5 family [Clostridium botulinum Ba4 str. 657]APU61058.1 CRISPR type III-B/RAMP module-associated protein Cmr5 [Clostridium botulinum]AXG90666.1 type III-B CRISPR module-associated protein Cmr5 [Clostridium botulinum]EDT85029.1 CRISPR-associated protein, Cmr5 family [Clostridium botulinum Bf]MBY6757135.1 type III-B CRISPR module-associated protein Cmr5 [Clostridium botulinum]
MYQTINIKDLKRKKASFAFNAIEYIQSSGDKKFKGYIRNIPMYIYTNGLIATIAFILKKMGTEYEREKGTDKQSYYEIGEILRDYFNKDFIEYDDKFKEKSLEDIMKELIKCDSKSYRRITLDILSILEWLVRFSDAMLEGEGESSEPI